MITVGLDVHKDWCQLVAVDDETNTQLISLQVESDPDKLRWMVEGLVGPKRVVMEEGCMSAWIVDALTPLVEEIVSCDPTVNTIISRAEDHNDENDARRLVLLHRAGALRPVYTPPEPFRTLRGLQRLDHGLANEIIRTRNRIKGLCRRSNIR
jgi:transposase